jgi:hypothetical protein
MWNKALFPSDETISLFRFGPIRKKSFFEAGEQ